MIAIIIINFELHCCTGCVEEPQIQQVAGKNFATIKSLVFERKAIRV